MFAALLGVILNSTLAPEAMADWGWRVPLLVGCAIIPFLFRLRRSLEETDEFLARPRRPAAPKSCVARWSQLGAHRHRHAAW